MTETQPRSDAVLPFFIVGCPRSGTTLLQSILDSHPDVAVPPESHFFRYYIDFIKAETSGSSPWRDPRLVDDLLRNFRIRSWGVRLDRDELLESAGDTAALVDNLFRQYAGFHEKRIWGDKTPQHALYLETILGVFPRARIIHLVRDGRDVAESYIRAFIGPSTISICAELWKKYIEKVAEMQARIPPQQFLKVRYEDLILKSEATQQEIWRFLQLRDPGELDIKQSTAAEIYSRLSYLHENNREALNSSRIGRFKSHLSHQQVIDFEKIAGSQLRQENYELQHDNGNNGGVVSSRIRRPVQFIDVAIGLARKIIVRNGRRQLKDDWTELVQRLRRMRTLKKIL